MPVNSKQKGAGFERELCQRLSLWVSNHRLKDVFWRSAMSGGRSTLAARRGEEFVGHGDITAVRSEGEALTDLFSIEAKFYRDLQNHLLVFGKKGKLTEFWAKHCKGCPKGKLPMIVAKQNFQTEIVVLSKEGVEALRRGGRLPVICTFHTMKPCAAKVVYLRDLLMTDARKVLKGA